MGENSLPDPEKLYSNGTLGLDDGIANVAGHDNEQNKEQKSNFKKYIAIAGGAVSGIIIGGALAFKLLSSPGYHDSSLKDKYKGFQTQATQTETVAQQRETSDKPYWVDKDGWCHFKPNAKELIEKMKKTHKNGYDSLIDAVAVEFIPEEIKKFKIVKIKRYSDGDIEVYEHFVTDKHKIIEDVDIYKIDKNGKYRFDRIYPVLVAKTIGKEE